MSFLAYVCACAGALAIIGAIAINAAISVLKRFMVISSSTH